MSVLILDDTDPRIQYEGSDWTLTTTGATDVDPAYNQTFHETRKDASLSLRFNGTSIGLYGAPGDQSATFTCTIDGKEANGIDPPPELRINYWVICNHAVEGPQEHLIILNVAVPEGATFRFDMIAYTSSQDVMERETVMIHENNPMITYQPPSNWDATAVSYITHTPGSSLALSFTGTAAAFYATLQSSPQAGTAEYSIDGGPTTAFIVPSSNHPSYNRPLFSASGLAPTKHSLVVTYTGQQSDAAPLEFDYFLITLPPQKEPPDAVSGKNPPQPSSESSLLPSSTETPPSSSDPLPPSSSLTNSPPPLPSSLTNSLPPLPSNSIDSLYEARSSKAVGAIVGGAVGGVIALSIIVLVIVIFVRRSRRRLYQSPESDITPFITLHRPQLDTRRQEKTMFAFNNKPGVVQHVDSNVRMDGPSNAVRGNPPRRKKH